MREWVKGEEDVVVCLCTLILCMDKIGEEIKRFIKHGMVCIEGMER